jgi:uncharacterized membrane protein
MPDGSLGRGVASMKTNENGIDRIIRGIAGVALLAVGLVFVKGTLGIVLAVVGAVLLVTGILGFCPIYALLHIGTKKS